MRVIKIDDIVWGEYFRLEVQVGEVERRVIGATPEIAIQNLESMLKFEKDLSKEEIDTLKERLAELREELILGKIEVETEKEN